MNRSNAQIGQILAPNIPTSLSNNKAKYQIFTPRDTVCLMLDLIEYRHNIIDKRILENSFGEGVFLTEIARRYIDTCLQKKLEPKTIARGLEKNLVGYEIDIALIDRARDSLNELAQSYGINNVNWDLRCSDALFDERKEDFHFIVGNPPYLSYKDIPEDYRKRLREKFESCRNGKFDYYYAFIESALSHLNENGILAQLVPNSIFKNVFAEKIRLMIKEGTTSIIDYSGTNIFDNVLVTPCIFVYKKNSNAPIVSVRKWNQAKENVFSKKSFSNKWVFAEEESKINKMRFGDTFHASMPIATLCNKAFLIDDSNSIEKALVYDAASPRTAKEDIEQKIIFPYNINQEKAIQRYDPDQFASRFPNGASYLKGFKNSLELRKSDSSTQWFEYGRSQGLRLVPLEKLLISTIVTGKITAYKLEENVVPYSGIVITAIDAEADLEEAKAILESDDFLKYAIGVGTSISGSSIRITCKDINEYHYSSSER